LIAVSRLSRTEYAGFDGRGRSLPPRPLARTGPPRRLCCLERGPSGPGSVGSPLVRHTDARVRVRKG
jgi:hypothetical protein